MACEREARKYRTAYTGQKKISEISAAAQMRHRQACRWWPGGGKWQGRRSRNLAEERLPSNIIESKYAIEKSAKYNLNISP